MAGHGATATRLPRHHAHRSVGDRRLCTSAPPRLSAAGAEARRTARATPSRGRHSITAAEATRCVPESAAGPHAHARATARDLDGLDANALGRHAGLDADKLGQLAGHRRGVPRDTKSPHVLAHSAFVALRAVHDRASTVEPQRVHVHGLTTDAWVSPSSVPSGTRAEEADRPGEAWAERRACCEISL